MPVLRVHDFDQGDALSELHVADLGDDPMVTPATIAAALHASVDDGLRLFAAADDTRTGVRPRPGAWCAREVLGHLIDSACNNHRRFVMGQSAELRRHDGYEQNAWVERQRYDEAPWRDLVALWTAYNRHLAHVIACAPAAALAHRATSPDGEEVTLGFVMEDYVRHLRHHLEQLRALLG
jgi:hypothetical protein